MSEKENQTDLIGQQILKTQEMLTAANAAREKSEQIMSQWPVDAPIIHSESDETKNTISDSAKENLTDVLNNHPIRGRKPQNVENQTEEKPKATVSDITKKFCR